MVDPAAADPDLPRARITKKQTSLACKRCRGRKQKVGDLCCFRKHAKFYLSSVTIIDLAIIVFGRMQVTNFRYTSLMDMHEVNLHNSLRIAGETT